MIARFTGPEGRRHVIAALQDQMLVGGDADLAATLADLVTIAELNAGETLFIQDADDNDMAFVLAGQVDVVVNGRRVATRRVGQQVGEMALIDTCARRSASIVAQDQCVVARITEADFTTLANGAPDLWRRLARELADRLRQRNVLVAERNEVPHVFVGSSSEHYSVATAIKRALSGPTVDVVTWKTGVFGPSGYALPSLEAEAERTDFAVLVLGPDDQVTSRKREQFAPRDNVILELGLFIGACGHERVFLLVPHGLDIKIPTDMLGITTVGYKPRPVRRRPAVEGAAAEILTVIGRKGPK